MKTNVFFKILCGAFFLLYSTQAFSEIKYQTDPKIQVLRELVTIFKDELKTDALFKNLVKNSFESLDSKEINHEEFWNRLLPEISSKVKGMSLSATAFLKSNEYASSDYSMSDFSLLLSNTNDVGPSSPNGSSISNLPCTERIETFANASFDLLETGLNLEIETANNSIASGSIITAIIFLKVEAIYCDCMLSTYGSGCKESDSFK